MHRDGGPAVWDERTHHDIANVFNDIAGDRNVLVVIYTGTGDSFNASWGGEHARASFKAPAEWAEEMGWYGRLRHVNMLEIDAIHAVRGRHACTRPALERPGTLEEGMRIGLTGRLSE